MNILNEVEQHLFHRAVPRIATEGAAQMATTTVQVATPVTQGIQGVATETSTVTTTAAPTAPAHTTGQIIDTILHDVLFAGSLAAMFFVKNPASQQKAAVLANGIQQLLNFLDPQLTGQAPTTGQ
jgi:hypothetical protein